MLNKFLNIEAGILAWCGAAISFFAPIQELVIFTILFVICDYFVSFIAATSAKIKKNTKPLFAVFKDVSLRYWFILIFSIIIVSLSWILGTHLIPTGLQLERTTASTICVFSLVNIIKNAAYITKSRAFSSINKFVKVKFQEDLK